MNQIGLPYERHSAGSREAAKKFKPYVKTARYRVFQYIKGHPRCCDQEISQVLEMNIKTVSPRRIELEREGLIRAAGQTKTPKGADATAFAVTDKVYPDPWPSTEFTFQKIRAQRPTPEEFAEAVEDLRTAFQIMRERGTPLSEVTVKVCSWVAKQGR